MNNLERKMTLKERAERLKSDIPRVYLCFMDGETPLPAKIAAGARVVYALSPIDFIPDFIPVLGALDDLIILPLLVALAIKLIPKYVWDKNYALSRDLWQNGRPERWYYSIPVIILWAMIIYRIVNSFFIK